MTRMPLPAKIAVSAICAATILMPFSAVAQDEAQLQGLQATPTPFTFVAPSIPQPAQFDVPDEPVADTVRLSDVEIVEAPAQSKYQPENSNLDLLDQGKTFDITCVIDKDGGMNACEAAPNSIRDVNFVEIALANVGQTVVGPVAHDGQPTEGRILRVTAHFIRADKLPAVSDLASAEP